MELQLTKRFMRWAISAAFLASAWFSPAWTQEPGTAPATLPVYEVVFEPVTARFFRLVAYSEAEGNDRVAAAAELRLLRAKDGGSVESVAWTVHGSSNSHGATYGSGLYAWDGEVATAWRSPGEPPHHLDIDLNASVNLAGFRYTPPVEGEGKIHRFAVYLSQDGRDWGTPVMRGTLVPREGGTVDETTEGAPDPLPLVRETFAVPEMVHGPVAIDVDVHQRVYVAETYRYEGRGVIDNRGKTRRELADLQTNRLSQRQALLETWLEDGELNLELEKRANEFLADGSDFLTKYSEKVALLEDRDGDGRADLRKVVAEGFNDPLDGAAAGVLVQGNRVYFACIPSVWMLTDSDGDDVSDRRDALSRGYGVRTGWFGHDLHGLTWGPDGRLYFSVADRGYDVRTREGKVLHGPDTGAVFRCWPDGSALELVAKGLRNPQELAFDDLGYLFTGDNNCDAGDRARLVQIVEGGDSGWRVSVQSLEDRGPWLGEAMWELPLPEPGLQPAWILPPLAYLNSGPSGFAAYPGTGLPASYDGYFFLCDYRGGRGSLQAFTLEPRGASFVMRGHHAFHDGPTVSDVCFGYDGKLYVSEWGPGWDISPHASIYTLKHALSQQSDRVREVATWFRQGFHHCEDSELVSRLGHRDRRVRYEAQRILADRGRLSLFAEVLATSQDRLSRLHAVWGLGMLARSQPDEVMRVVLGHINEADAEVQGRLLRLCADNDWGGAGETARVALGAVHSPRLRFHAAYAVGKLKPEGALMGLLDFVQANHGGDAYLRHAAVMGLTYLNQPDVLREQAERSEAESVRLATVLALRRLGNVEVRRFLNDPSAVVATEAARAIYDTSLDGGFEALAAALSGSARRRDLPAPFLVRAIHANFQEGSPQAAERLCVLARDPEQLREMRQLALQLLLRWDQPPKRDGVWGRWLPLSRESAGLAKGAVRTHLQDLLGERDVELQALAQRLDSLYGKEKSPEELAEMVKRDTTTEVLRVEALRALEKLKSSHRELFDSVCREALAEEDSPALRAAAILAWVRVQGDAGMDVIESFVRHGATAVEKQAAVRAAGVLPQSSKTRLLGDWMKALEEGELDPQIQLDVFEMAENSGVQELQKQCQDYRERRGDWGIHQLSLHGGDPAIGEKLFVTNLAAQCMRCHSLRGRGGDVGPPMDGLAKRRDVEHMLRSVVDPQFEVAKGYGLQTVKRKSGAWVTGTLVAEDEESVVIRQEGALQKVALNEIAERSQVVSGMPPAGLVLKPRELRDLMAFLQTLD